MLTGCIKALDFKQVSIVVDGDTVILQGDSTSRLDLAYIDAPEREQPYGREAKDYLKQLVDSNTLQVLLNDNNQIEILQNNQSVNLRLVAQGYAWASPNISDPINATRYIEAQKTAVANLNGLWGLGHGLMVAPWQWRQQGTERAVIPRRLTQQRTMQKSMQQHKRKVSQLSPIQSPKPSLASIKNKVAPKQEDTEQ